MEKKEWSEDRKKTLLTVDRKLACPDSMWLPMEASKKPPISNSKILLSGIHHLCNLAFNLSL